MFNRTTPKPVINPPALRKINREFYNLIKKLQKNDLIQTACIAEFAYEKFLSELNRSIKQHRLN